MQAGEMARVTTQGSTLAPGVAPVIQLVNTMRLASSRQFKMIQGRHRTSEAQKLGSQVHSYLVLYIGSHMSYIALYWWEPGSHSFCVVNSRPDGPSNLIQVL